MKWQRQGPSECALATIAMLADVPLSDVREYACLIAGADTWSQFCKRNGGTFWQVVNQVTLDLGLGLQWPPKLGSFRVAASDAEPDLSGRGAVLVLWTDGSAAHAMAFEDGWVYDPNQPVRLRWSEWVETTPREYGRVVKMWVIAREQ